MMADAYGKLTGKPGICMVTRGPGATNASSGVHVAFQGAPILLVRQSAAATRCLATARYLSTNAAGIVGGYAYGREAAIGDDMLHFAQDLISGQATAGC